jgi:thiol-disulfide isomerase/thioredoxin
MIDTAAYNFELKDLNGKAVRLSDFKGKVVILDFWAIWCGPCKASFPMMQQAVDRYKTDKDVVFLFIHTREKGADATKAAADYIKDKKFTFNVLMDLKDPATLINPAATGYKVNGIPALFVIDGAGNIRFRTTGVVVAGRDVFMEEMDAMIGIAKKG